MIRTIRALSAGVACILSFCSTSAFAQAATLDFTSVADGTNVTSSSPVTANLSSGAGTVTFSSSATVNPFSFSVASAGFYTGIGPSVLTEGGFSGDSLTLTFSQAQTNFSFFYSLSDFAPGLGGAADNLSTLLSNGSTITSTAVDPGNGDLYVEGKFAYSGAAITSLTLTSASAITIAATPAPEPSTWALLAAGLLAVGGIARRRQAAQA